jgi:hypothetical protein
MTRQNAFIFPSSGKSATISNPYIDDFTASLSDHFVFVNKLKPSKTGILNLYSYLGKIDIVFFNWIEDIPDRKAGMLQTILLLILLYIIKLRKIKIFYTLHNKESHFTTNRYIKRLLRIILLKKADFILCHSSEGLKMMGDKQLLFKTKFLPHPFRKNFSATIIPEKKYDILIWGAIRRYKGIDAFLKYLGSRNMIDKYRILIVGKIFPAEYEDELKKYKSDVIRIENKFIEDDPLNELIDQSVITLFTYQENSVLSSGALIYSLSQGALVIGPQTGAFKDFYSEGLIDVFDNYDELIEKINFHLVNPNEYLGKLQDYISKNTWNVFASHIVEWIINS